MEKEEKLKGPYAVSGYDKDNDVYEKLCLAGTLTRALQIAAAIARYHKEEELHRFECREPFDWFVVMDAGGNICRTFTTEEPDGFTP